jgi:hypothetical protein
MKSHTGERVVRLETNAESFKPSAAHQMWRFALCVVARAPGRRLGGKKEKLPDIISKGSYEFGGPSSPIVLRVT